MLMRLRLKEYFSGTRVEILWKNFLGRTMAWDGLAEEPSPTRYRILPVMVEDLPMGLVPTLK